MSDSHSNTNINETANNEGNLDSFGFPNRQYPEGLNEQYLPQHYTTDATSVVNHDEEQSTNEDEDELREIHRLILQIHHIVEDQDKEEESMIYLTQVVMKMIIILIMVQFQIHHHIFHKHKIMNDVLMHKLLLVQQDH